MGGTSSATNANSEVTRSIGARIRASRRQLGLSTRAAARRLNVSTRFLNELERGKSTVRLDKVLLTLHGLGLGLEVHEREPGLAKPRFLEEVRAQVPLLQALAARHGVKSLWLFGSAARGDAHGASDLDFIAELERSRSLLDLIALKADLEVLFGRSVDVFTRASLKGAVLRDAARDEIRVL